MSKGKGKGKDVDWEEEKEGRAGDDGMPGDAELEDLESEALDAGDDPDDGDPEDDREDDIDGNREDDRDPKEPATLEEARERLSALEARRKDENRGMRSTITKLRRRGRQQRLEEPRGAPAQQTPELKIPDSMTLEINDDGKPVLSQNQIKELVEAQRAVQAPSASRGQRAVDATATRYQGFRDDFIDDTDDPETAEQVIDELEGAYNYLNRQFEKMIKGGERPRNADEVYDIFEEDGTMQSFKKKYPTIDPMQLLEAPTSQRKFDRLVNDRLDDLERSPRRGRKRGRVTLRRDRDDDEDEGSNPIPRRRAGRVDQDDDGPARGALRRSPRRSMRRRGGERQPSDSTSLQRFADADVEDVLNMKREDIEEVARRSSKRRTRQTR